MVTDFTILKDAGVTQAEFGTLVGVSRVSVNKWAKGTPISKKHKQKTAAWLKLIAVAVQTDKLPLQSKVPNRDEAIKAVLVDIYREIKAKKAAEAAA